MLIDQKEKAWKLWRGGEFCSETGRKAGRAPGANFLFLSKILRDSIVNYGIGLIELFRLMSVKKFRVDKFQLFSRSIA